MDGATRMIFKATPDEMFAAAAVGTILGNALSDLIRYSIRRAKRHWAEHKAASDAMRLVANIGSFWDGVISTGTVHAGAKSKPDIEVEFRKIEKPPEGIANYKGGIVDL